MDGRPITNPATHVAGIIPEPNTNDPFRVVELFCGAGGMSLGLLGAGMQMTGAADNSPAAVAAYSRNVGAHVRVVDLSRPQDALPWIASLRPHMIAGGPPCQDFSAAGKRIEGERAGMTVAMAMICSATRPEWVLMENVQRAANSTAWREALGILRKSGYGLTQLVLNAALFGVPQRRKRLILVGRIGERDGFLDAALLAAADGREMTLRDEFGDLFGEHVYHHPRFKGRSGVHSVDEPSHTVRAARRPQPQGYEPHPKDSNYVQPVAGMHFRGHAGARAVRGPEEPAPGIIRTSRERPRASYMANPHPDDFCAAGKAYVPTQSDMSRIQGFPVTYDWSPVRLVRDVDQMIANAVPPPLAARIATVILRRHRGEDRLLVEGNFLQWLSSSGSASNRQVASNIKWRVSRARRFLGNRTFSNALLERQALDSSPGFRELSVRDRSSLHSALRYYREWLDRPQRKKKTQIVGCSVAADRWRPDARSTAYRALNSQTNDHPLAINVQPVGDAKEFHRLIDGRLQGFGGLMMAGREGSGSRSFRVEKISCKFASIHFR